MIFRQLFDPDSSTYTYLLGDEVTREAVIIDPVRERLERDLTLVRELGLQLVHALDTHVHADHVTAAGLIAQRTGAQTVAGRLGAACAHRHLGAGERVPFGRYSLEVLETPGHTDDSVSYRLPDRVFTGDALLVRGCGRTDFQNGDARTLYHSITSVLFALPEDTLVFPGHDYRGMTVSTIGEEKHFNPRLAGKSAEEFATIMRGLKLGLPARIMEAVPANRACGLDETAGLARGLS
jgi:glyoxylase-like metal-dependent hydrolase (beta-lactamase superfamily II)